MIKNIKQKIEQYFMVAPTKRDNFMFWLGAISVLLGLLLVILW